MELPKVSEKLMIFVFIAPTPTGVLLTPSGYLPTVRGSDDYSFQQLMNGLRDRYQADLQLLVPIGRSTNGDAYYSVGEVFEQGFLASMQPPSNIIGLLTALARGMLSNWSLDVKGENDFSISFLGS